MSSKHSRSKTGGAQIVSKPRCLISDGIQDASYSPATRLMRQLAITERRHLALKVTRAVPGVSSWWGSGRLAIPYRTPGTGRIVIASRFGRAWDTACSASCAVATATASEVSATTMIAAPCSRWPTHRSCRDETDSTPGLCSRACWARSAKSGSMRSEERRVGKECSQQCRSRWSPYH